MPHQHEADICLPSCSQQEISFQMFRNQLLAKGLVDKLEVSNKSLVKVFVRTGAPSLDADGQLQGGGGAGNGRPAAPGQPQSVYKYFFHVGSVDSFERKMEEAQEALGISLGEEVRTAAALSGARQLWRKSLSGLRGNWCMPVECFISYRRMCGGLPA
jgi:hypothetical protein